MARTLSTMLELDTDAPDFNLPEPLTGETRSLSDFADARALLVIFMCNHCPYVKLIRQGLADFAAEYTAKGLAIVAINANDAEAYPEDAPDKMVDEVRSAGYVFAYLYDETQETAKAYHAACTPDFFLFDQERKLVYRGQFDDSRPGNSVEVTGADLRAAADAVLESRQSSMEQKPSMGCNIKWKTGNQPDY